MSDFQKKIAGIGLIIAIILISIAAVIVYFRTEKIAPLKENPTMQIIPTPTSIPGETIMVSVHGFVPDRVEVKVGSYINIANFSDTLISIKSDQNYGAAESKVLNIGELKADDVTELVRFDKPGTYTFYNALKPTQKGTLVVK